jgi:hypothetical protein
MAATTLITVPQFLRLIGPPNSPAVVDVRIDDDYGADPRLVQVLKGGITVPSAIGPGSIEAKASLSLPAWAEIERRDCRVLRHGGIDAAM